MVWGGGIDNQGNAARRLCDCMSPWIKLCDLYKPCLILPFFRIGYYWMSAMVGSQQITLTVVWGGGVAGFCDAVKTTLVDK